MNIYRLSDLTLEQREHFRQRSAKQTMNESTFEAVRAVFEKVKSDGDEGVLAATAQFDGVNLEQNRLLVGTDELNLAWSQLPASLKRSLEQAINNHRLYNEKMMPPAIQMHTLQPGVSAGRKAVPLDRVALYVPSGKGSYPSTFVTLAVPALVAGVRNISVIVPPGPGGSVDPAILAAAQMLGITDIYRANGVAATAAVTYGTATFRRVDQIIGPGSPFIMAAQMLAQLHGVAAKPCFGPSECMIIADDSADPELAAADLINEAEHGMESSAILITDSMSLALRTADCIRKQLPLLPERRRQFAESALGVYGGIVIVDRMDEAVELANEWGNEHIQVATRDPWSIAGRITSAAELLIGQHTTFSAISYAIGVPACLPTGAFTRIHSGVAVDTFLRYSAVAELTPQGLERLAGTIAELADHEGFPAHRRSIDLRASKGIIMTALMDFKTKE